VQQLLGYAGFAYVAGFTTLTMHTARYGIPVLDLATPFTVWVGAIPAATLFLATFGYRLLNEGTGFNMQKTGLRQVARDLMIVAVTIACGLAFSSYLAWFARLARNESLAEWADGHSRILPALFAIGLFVYTVVNLARIHNIKTAKDVGTALKEYSRRYIFSVLMIGTLALYIWVGYPRWPQKYGFGHPIYVQLVLDAEASPSVPVAESASAAGSSVSGTSERKTLLTAPMELLFKTEKEYVIRYRSGEKGENIRIVSIDSGLVKATIWH
jgi:hypothetical protein